MTSSLLTAISRKVPFIIKSDVIYYMFASRLYTQRSAFSHSRAIYNILLFPWTMLYITQPFTSAISIIRVKTHQYHFFPLIAIVCFSSLELVVMIYPTRIFVIISDHIRLWNQAVLVLLFTIIPIFTDVRGSILS